MVAQTRPLSHLTVAVGSYLNFTLDPLSVVNIVSGKRLVQVVGNRLELDVMGASAFGTGPSSASSCPS